MNTRNRANCVQLVKVSLLVAACGSFMGCLNNLNPNNLTVKGLCTTFLAGSSSTNEPAGVIKIANMASDMDEEIDDAVYDFIVDAGALNTYDFRIMGQSINANFVDAPGGKKRFGGSVHEADMATIEVFLKQTPTTALEDAYTVVFYNPNLPAGSSQAGNRSVKTVEGKIKVEYRTAANYEDSGVVPFELGGASLQNAYYSALVGFAASVEVDGSAEVQGSQVPGATEEIFAAGYVWTTYPQPPGNFPGKALTNFPCGAGMVAFTVCPSMANDLDEPMGVGYTVAGLVVDDDIPLADPTNYYTYSFVFDTDGEAANNWVPLADFPNDFFQGTDRWYEIAYEPGMGWELICSQVTDGASQTVTRGIPTAANAMIVGHAVMLVVPDSEIYNITKTSHQVGVRYTAFKHTGDFGLQPPYTYSADVEPRVEDGLLPVE